jgi:hypothetical protein
MAEKKAVIVLGLQEAPNDEDYQLSAQYLPNATHTRFLNLRSLMTFFF